MYCLYQSSRNYISDYLLTHPFAQHTGNDVIFELCAASFCRPIHVDHAVVTHGYV